MFDRLIAALGKSLPPGGKNYCMGDILPFVGYLDGKPPREPGVAALCREGGMLCVYAAFRDSDIFSDAGEGERTWMRGDVFELFLQKPGQEGYAEFHTAPTGVLLQLRFPDPASRFVGNYTDKIFNGGLKSEIEVRREENLWLVKMLLPYEGGLTGAKFLFGRYNYTRGVKEPEISSSTAVESTFHAPAFWHIVKEKSSNSTTCR